MASKGLDWHLTQRVVESGKVHWSYSLRCKVGEIGSQTFPGHWTWGFIPSSAETHCKAAVCT